MKTPISLIVLLFLIFSFNITHQSSVNSTDTTKPVEAKIVGGTTADIRIYPYQVSVRNFRGNHFCGGSIIGRRTILTAAHCINGQTPTWLTIRAGSNYHANGGQILNVRKGFVHPKYNTRTFDNDIGLLILDQDLKWETNVKPIPVSQTAIPVGKMAVVTGWGTTAEGARISPNLQKLDVVVFKSETCESLYKGKITSNMFCAGYIEGNKDSCQGDSGGPLMYNQEIIGVVSWGIGCARARNPGVYTYVSKYQSWIRDNLNRYESK